MEQLEPMATEIATLLRERGETVAVVETTAGGLVSAALLAVGGASVYYRGGAVTYTGIARDVLLDVDMPGRYNGLEVCRRITAEANGPVVIMVTGRSTPESRKEGLAAGASAYLTKPFSPLELLERLETAQEEIRGKP